MDRESFSRRKLFWPTLFIVAIAYLISGCALIANRPLEVSLTPKAPTVPINIGRGTIIYLSVLDQRSEKSLGSRVDEAAWQRLGWGEFHGTISAVENIVGLVQNSLTAGLASLGFETLTAPEPSVSKLEVALRSLKYWEEGRAVNGLIEAKLYKSDRLLYENSYSYAFQCRSVFLPFDRSWFETNFNAALSDLMGQLLADLELLAKLKS